MSGLRHRLRRWRARWRLAVRRGVPVLLYHAVSRHPPESEERLHNVPPEVLHDQLRWLGRHVRFVPVDELAAARDPRGLAAVTFDDGYHSVVDEALPVLADLGVPATLFVNGATLLGRPMWRQKVRRVIHRGWAGEWERGEREGGTRRTRPVAGKSFYSATKDPVNDSAVVEAELDAFLAERGETVDGSGLWLRLDELRPRPGIAYGNHGHRHYVMSSLPRDRQAAEIEETRRLLAAIPGIEVSRVFSVPFGAAHHLDETTAELLRDLGYTAALLCRSRLGPPRPSRLGGLPLVERFMPDARPMLANLADLGLERPDRPPEAR